MKARIKHLSTQITDLSERMATFWQDMEAENITFLQVQSKHSKMHTTPGIKVNQRAVIWSKRCLIINVCDVYLPTWLNTNCFLFLIQNYSDTLQKWVFFQLASWFWCNNVFLKCSIVYVQTQIPISRKETRWSREISTPFSSDNDLHHLG